MCEKNGVSGKVRSFVYKELERQGKGAKKDIRIVFEFDSDESVKRDFYGDYDLRLR